MSKSDEIIRRLSKVEEDGGDEYETVRNKLISKLEEIIDTDFDFLWNELEPEDKVKLFIHLSGKLLPRVGDELSKTKKIDKDKDRQNRKEIEQIRKDAEENKVSDIIINLQEPAKQKYKELDQENLDKYLDQAQDGN